MRTVSATLATAQSSDSRNPYIRALFTSKDGLTTKDFSTDSAAFGNRILSIEHNEEPYNDYAFLVLKNYDNTIPSIKGYWAEIGYGDTTGAGNEYIGSQTSRLYVKHQRHVTAQGQLYTVLELEGLWTRMHQDVLRLGTAPLFQVTYNLASSTIWSILRTVIAEAGCSLPVTCPVNDGIITTLLTAGEFYINKEPYEKIIGVIYRLIQMTKCFLRSPSVTGTEFGVVYPQAADAAVLTYNSHSSPYFYSFMERNPVLVPNYFVVYGNAGSDGDWTGLVTSASPNGVSQADIDALYEVYSIIQAPTLTAQADVNNQAAVALVRARAENGTGFAVIPHDCRVELYDKLAFVDNRGGGTTYPSNNMTRVTGLKHRYQPGLYRLEVHLGGLSTTDTELYTNADNIIMSRLIGGKPPIDMTSEEQAGLKALAEINKQIEQIQNNINAQKQADLFSKWFPVPEPPKSPISPVAPTPDKGYWDVEGMNPIERELENPDNYPLTPKIPTIPEMSPIERDMENPDNY